MIYLTWDDVFTALRKVDRPGEIVYGVPNGGMIAAGFLREAQVTPFPEKATIILDDLEDSGRTREHYQRLYPDIPFVVLFEKPTSEWLVLPWETQHPGRSGEIDSVQSNITRILEYIGEDPKREGLVDTPNRVIRSWGEIFSGYKQNPADYLTVFDSDGYDQIIISKNIEFFSLCEHHMLPFFGKAHIAYIPDKKIIGISKLARLLEVYSRRLQIQERIGDQVTSALMTHLEPKGAACILEASHMCMQMRGVNKQQSVMTTSSMKGVFFDDARARSELMNLIQLR